MLRLRVSAAKQKYTFLTVFFFFNHIPLMTLRLLVPSLLHPQSGMNHPGRWSQPFFDLPLGSSCEEQRGGDPTS